MLWQIIFCAAGVLCLGYYFLIAGTLRKWNSTFSSFWLAAGIFLLLGSFVAERLGCMGIFGILLLVFVLTVLFTCLLIGSGMRRGEKEPCRYLIVLGAQVSGRRITDSLKLRLDRAKEYLIQKFHLDYKSYDIIIGYRADDSYFSFAADFINGAISYRQLSNAMRLGKLGRQFVLKSKRSFERLRFLGYETADYREWYKKKAFRDKSARRQYFDVERNRRQKGDLYITTILDEEMTADDPRIR